MSNWLQNQFRAAEGLLEAVDRTAKQVSKKDLLEERARTPEQSSTSRSDLGSRKSSARNLTAVAAENDAGRAEGKRGSAQPSNTQALTDSQPASQWSRQLPESLPSSLQTPESAVKRQPRLPVESASTNADRESPLPPLASLFGPPQPATQQKREPPASEPQSSPQPTLARKNEVKQPAVTSLPALDVPDMEKKDQGLEADQSPRQEGGEGDDDSAGGAGIPASSASGRAELEAGVQTVHEPEAAHPSVTQQPEQPREGPDTEPTEPGPASADTALPAVNGRRDGAKKEAVPSQTTHHRAGSTADAVTEAIKAATEATGPSGVTEDVDSGVEGRLREARLVKMVDSLKQRLERLRAENEQLEEMLSQADVTVKGRGGDVDRLEGLLANALAAESRAKAELIEERSERQSEAKGLNDAVKSAEHVSTELRRRLTVLEGENERLLQDQDASEARTLTMLREELSAAEQRLEDERFAAASARQLFSAREQELEAALAESGAALAGQQRVAEERGKKLNAVENRAVLLEAEAAQLRSELEEQSIMRSSAEEPAGKDESEVQGLRERTASLQAALANSEGQKRSLDGELSQLRGEVDGLRMQLSTPSPQPSAERQIKEMSDLLYQKQSQLEKMAADRSAQHMAWEQQLKQAREEAETSRRKRVDRSNGLLDGDLVVPMEDIGETYHRLANNKRVGKAVKAGAKMLDATTLTVVRFLKQYPLGRLVILVYAIFIHLFVYTLISHLQQQALHTEHKGLHLDDN